MSDSDDLSTPANLPADSEIEDCLRSVVRDANKNEEDITINLARSRAERELGLDAGFLKENDQWKRRSKDLINAAVEELPSPEQSQSSKLPSKPSSKRKSEELQGKRKRLKRSPVVASDEEQRNADDAPVQNEDSEEDISNEPRKTQPKSELESALSDVPNDESEPPAPSQNGKPAEEDDSDLSSVLDDAPPPKKKGSRQKKSTSPSTIKSKTKPTKTNKAKADKPDKTSKELTPDEEEIKRLQSWLLKCGVRKLWHRELAPYQTPKEKIKHLKEMLEDVGMTPRYSAEKARAIKEARELKAELEAAREFNEKWGHEEEEGSGGEGPATKRLRPKGLVDFGDSDDESE